MIYASNQKAFENLRNNRSQFVKQIITSKNSKTFQHDILNT